MTHYLRSVPAPPPAPRYLQRLFGLADGTDGGEGGLQHDLALTRFGTPSPYVWT